MFGGTVKKHPVKTILSVFSLCNSYSPEVRGAAPASGRRRAGDGLHIRRLPPHHRAGRGRRHSRPQQGAPHQAHRQDP